MKRFGIVILGVAGINLLLWTVSLGLDIENRIRYRLKSSSDSSVVVLQGNLPTRIAGSADNSTDVVPAPRNHPPLRIVCGAYVFNVVYASHEWMQNTHRYAMTNMEERRIVLDRQRSDAEVREDVLHELIHISLWEADGKWLMPSGTPEEEGYIKPIAPRLRDILADNPRLVRWLTQSGG